MTRRALLAEACHVRAGDVAFLVRKTSDTMPICPQLGHFSCVVIAKGLVMATYFALLCLARFALVRGRRRRRACRR